MRILVLLVGTMFFLTGCATTKDMNRIIDKNLLVSGETSQTCEDMGKEMWCRENKTMAKTDCWCE